MDQVRMRLRLVREPVAALRLRLGVPAGPAQRRPSARTRRAPPKTFSGLSARQACIDGSQDTRAKIKRERLRHEGRPPSPAPTLNQIKPSFESPSDSIRADAALTMPMMKRAMFAPAPVTDSSASTP